MTTIVTTPFERKPLLVNAVQVTDENIQDIAKWCNGLYLIDQTEPSNPKGYVKVHVKRPMNLRHTMAYVGDWILSDGHGYKIFNDNAFHNSFMAVKTVE